MILWIGFHMFEWCLIQCWVLLFIYSGASIKKIWSREKTGKYGDDGYPGGLSKGVLYWFWTSKCVKSRCIPWGTVYFTIKEEYHLICLGRPKIAAVLFKSALTYSNGQINWNRCIPWGTVDFTIEEEHHLTPSQVSRDVRCSLEPAKLKLQAFFFEKIWPSLFSGLSLPLSLWSL